MHLHTDKLSWHYHGGKGPPQYTQEKLPQLAIKICTHWTTMAMLMIEFGSNKLFRIHLSWQMKIFDSYFCTYRKKSMMIKGIQTWMPFCSIFIVFLWFEKNVNFFLPDVRSGLVKIMNTLWNINYIWNINIFSSLLFCLKNLFWYQNTDKSGHYGNDS